MRTESAYRTNNPGVILNNGAGTGWIRPVRDTQVFIGKIGPARRRPADDPRACPLEVIAAPIRSSVTEYRERANGRQLVWWWINRSPEEYRCTDCHTVLIGKSDLPAWIAEDEHVTILEMVYGIDPKDGGKRVFAGAYLCWTKDLPLVKRTRNVETSEPVAVPAAGRPALYYSYPAAPLPPAGNVPDIEDVWQEWRAAEDERNRKARRDLAKRRAAKAAAKFSAASAPMFVTGVSYQPRKRG